MDTLKRSRERLQVAVADTILIADADSLVAPMWISMGNQCEFDSSEPEITDVPFSSSISS